MRKTFFLLLLSLCAAAYAHAQPGSMRVINNTSCDWYVWFDSPVEDCHIDERTVSKKYNIAAGATVTFADFNAVAWTNGVPNTANDWDRVYVLNPCHGTNINYAMVCSMNGAFEGMLLATRFCGHPIDYACVDVTPCGSCDYVYGKLVPAGSGWELELYQ